MEIWQLKVLVYLGPHDFINDAMNMNIYKFSHNPMIHMYSEFNDDIFVHILVIMKMFFIHL